MNQCPVVKYEATVRAYTMKNAETMSLNKRQTTEIANVSYHAPGRNVRGNHAQWLSSMARHGSVNTPSTISAPIIVFQSSPNTTSVDCEARTTRGRQLTYRPEGDDTTTGVLQYCS